MLEKKKKKDVKKMRIETNLMKIEAENIRRQEELLKVKREEERRKRDEERRAEQEKRARLEEERIEQIRIEEQERKRKDRDLRVMKDTEIEDRTFAKKVEEGKRKVEEQIFLKKQQERMILEQEEINRKQKQIWLKRQRDELGMLEKQMIKNEERINLARDEDARKKDMERRRRDSLRCNEEIDELEERIQKELRWRQREEEEEAKRAQEELEKRSAELKRQIEEEEKAEAERQRLAKAEEKRAKKQAKEDAKRREQEEKEEKARLLEQRRLEAIEKKAHEEKLLKQRLETEAKEKKIEEERAKAEKERLEALERERLEAERIAREAKEAHDKEQQEFLVKMAEGKPRFTKTLIGAVAEPGEVAVFKCEVSHDSPCDVIWLKDTQQMDDELMDRVQATCDGDHHQLKVMGCRPEDTGIYMAKATAMDGEFATTSAQLLVQELTPEERQARLEEKAPFFLVTLRDTTVVETTNLSYVVHVNGDPMPNVSFTKDDVAIEEDPRVSIHKDFEHGHYEMLIRHVTKEDAGVYMCHAESEVGSADCQCTMTVMDKADLVESGEGFGNETLKLDASHMPGNFKTIAIATKEGEEKDQLHGKGTLVPEGEKTDFQWFRDGQEFDPYDRFSVHFKDDEDTLALVFQNVTPDDAGLYTCVAATSCGKISCSAELTVEGSVKRLAKDPAPPSMIEELQDIYVAKDGTAFLECRIGGFPVPDLKWAHDGMPVTVAGRIKQMWENEDSVSLIMKNITQEDVGFYKLIAKNELGETECGAYLRLKVGPKIGDMPRDVSFDIGSSWEYSAEVEGEPVATVVWQKDGIDLRDGGRISYRREGTRFTLHIDNMTVDDVGTYTLNATNDVGQRSENFKVQANIAPVIYRALDPETEKKIGNDHTFEVRANGCPPPTATWYKNGRQLYADEKYKMIKDDHFYMLKIRDLDRSDRGQFKLVLSNSLGEASCEGTLIIRAPPEWRTKVKDAYGPDGSENAQMFCEWSSHPRSDCKWTFNDMPLRQDTPGFKINNTETTSMLTIFNVNDEFKGNYGIIVGNEYGDIEGKCRLRLHEPPVMIKHLENLEFTEEEMSKIVFLCSGVPPPEVKWTVDDTPYTPDGERVDMKREGDDVHVLTLGRALTKDSGHYHAKIVNCEGQTETECDVTVNTPPHILSTNFEEGVRSIAAHEFKLEVKASSVPVAEAIWSLNGTQLEANSELFMNYDSETEMYTLERPCWDPEHSGEYTCKLRNKIKEESKTGNVEIYEWESRVRIPLKEVIVHEYNVATFKCQIVGDPVPRVQWFRNGEEIPEGKFEVSEDERHWRTLVFNDVREADKCTFTCKGYNENGDCETTCDMIVYVVPQPEPMKNVTVDWGTDVRITAMIHAIPPPKMTWFQDGIELQDCDHTQYERAEDLEAYSLFLKFAELPDIGSFSFLATNPAGEADGKLDVHVHSVKPSVSQPLESKNVCLEDQVTFTVTMRGLPTPVPTWTHNEVEVTSDMIRAVMETTGDGFTHTLTLLDLKKEDYGKISVVGKHVVGETKSKCKLTQKTIECEFLEDLERLTKGSEGEDVKMTLIVRASPRPTVVWTRDGDVMEDTDSCKITQEKINYSDLKLTLTLLDANSLQSGQYRVKVKNQVNEINTETALVVKPVPRPPTIKRKTKELKVAAKETAMFKFQVSGFPRPDVKWVKEGRELQPSDVVRTGMTVDGCQFLELRHVSTEDAGQYQLLAFNDQGRADATCTLAVKAPKGPPEFLTEMHPVAVIAGYPCRFEVKCDGHPAPTMTWMKDGSPLEIDGERIKTFTLEDGTEVLQILDVEKEVDAGQYTCVATNAEGDHTSSSKLSVKSHKRKDGQDGPPAFISGLKDVTADEGATLILPVSVGGGPVPDLKWFKDSSDIVVDGRIFYTYDGDRAFLEVRACTGDDSGTYKCVLTGKDGTEVTSECNVIIRKCFSKPAFSQAFHNVQQMPELDIRLSVHAEGVPNPDLAWFKDGKAIDFCSCSDRYRLKKEGEATTLIVKKCEYGDAGVYRVTASNQEGEATHESAVEVVDDIDPEHREVAPVFLKNIGDQELFENETAKFKAVVTGKPLPEFTWTKDGRPLSDSSRIIPERDQDGILRLTIKHVEEMDSGKYSLKVWNAHGKASCSGKLICECISKKARRDVGEEYQGFDKLRAIGAPMPLPDQPWISALSDRRCTVSWNPYVPQGSQYPVTYTVEMCECPEGSWITARTGIRGTSVDVCALIPKVDYKFRVRNENQNGISQPSPYAMTHRTVLEIPPNTHEPKVEFNYAAFEDGPYVPKGFVLDRTAKGNYYAAPRFLHLDHDTQYGQKGYPGQVKWYAFGYPTPKITFFYKSKKLKVNDGDKYIYNQQLTGEIVLFIDKIKSKDEGWYECVAKNEHGESRQSIRIELCEYPRVTQHLEEMYMRTHGNSRIMCRIAGHPPCDVVWFKDWQPLQTSFRIKPQFIAPDMYILNFTGAHISDSGLYSLSAVNVAGSASSSCMVQVVDDDFMGFVWTGPAKGVFVTANKRRGNLEDHYDVGDELGRGTQGITHHCCEHHSGLNVAAKSMWGTGQLREWMLHEIELMNLSNSSKHIVRMYDAYVTDNNVTIVTELCGGGELLHTLTQRQFITEHEIAHYITQVLLAIEYLHDRCLAHMGLNIGDVLLTRNNGTDIKICDFSLARKIRAGKQYPCDYGMPEFVAPEIVKGDGVSYPVDMWATGVITYILLSGTSPFRGENDRETLSNVKAGKLSFDADAFDGISEDAKDFCGQLMQVKPMNRMDVKAALNHPWLLKSQLQPRDPHKINTDRLRTYAAKYRAWYTNASCRRWFRRRALDTAFSHPTKMVYPPNEVYTPDMSPEPEETALVPADYHIPAKDLTIHCDPVINDSRYQQGPDTYLLQLRDTEFPCRLRQYMKIAADRSPSFAHSIRTGGVYDYQNMREPNFPTSTDTLGVSRARSSTPSMRGASPLPGASSQELAYRRYPRPRGERGRSPSVANSRCGSVSRMSREPDLFVPARFDTSGTASTELQYIEESDLEARSRLVHRAQLNFKESKEMGNYLKLHEYFPTHLKP